MYPQSAKTNALYADLLYNSDQLTKSAEYYKESLKYDKSNFMIWKQLMIIYTNIEDWKSLEKLSVEAIDYYPNHALPYYYAGRANIKLNNSLKQLNILMKVYLYLSKMRSS